MSNKSHFTDDTWDFVEETGDPRMLFHWDRLLSNGLPLCSKPGIVHPLKLYAEALKNGRVISGRRPKIVSIWKTVLRLRIFAEYLIVDCQISSFAEVLPSHHSGFVEKLRIEKSREASAEILTTVVRFFDAQKHTGLHLALGAAPDFGMSPRSLFRVLKSNRKQTAVIPPHILQSLFLSTLSFVRDVGPYLLAVQARFDPIEQEYLRHPVTSTFRRPSAPPDVFKLFAYGTNRRRVNFHYARFERLTNNIPKPTDPQGAAHPLMPEGVRDVNELRAALDHLLTACFVLIGLTTGMRRDELGSIEEGCMREKLLSSGRRIYQIFAVLRKGTSANSGKLVPWVCDETIGRMAVETLEKITRTARAVKQSRRLFTAIQQSATRRHVAQGSLVRLDWESRLKSYTALLGLDWRLKPHQLRRAFVRLVVRWSDVSLLSLQSHLKHLNSHMTDYYVGTDTELWQIWFSEAAREPTDTLAEAMADEHLAGPGGKILKEQIDDAIVAGTLPKHFRGKAGEGVRLKLAEQWILGGTPVHFLSTNICSFRSEVAMCNPGGEHPITNLCSAGCKNNIISKSRHTPAWLLAARQNMESQKKHKNSVILREPLRKEGAVIAKVLKDLEIDPSNFSVK